MSPGNGAGAAADAPDRRGAADVLPPRTRRFYRRVMQRLTAAGLRFLVGGGYALEHYTRVSRPIKDLDLFVRPRDVDAIRAALEAAGWRTTVPFPHWLAKVHEGRAHVDLIFGSGNGMARVDDGWFAHAAPARFLDVPVALCPPEEMIASKAFVMERERFDGGDVAHLIGATAESLDWDRLERRFGEHWRVLFAHLVLFGFIYPAERHRVPEALVRRCVGRLEDELAAGPLDTRVCQGTLISRAQFAVDTEHWGYEDARVTPHGPMTRGEASRWTARSPSAVTTRPADEPAVSADPEPPGAP